MGLSTSDVLQFSKTLCDRICHRCTNIWRLVSQLDNAFRLPLQLLLDIFVQIPSEPSVRCTKYLVIKGNTIGLKPSNFWILFTFRDFPSVFRKLSKIFSSFIQWKFSKALSEVFNTKLSKLFYSSRTIMSHTTLYSFLHWWKLSCRPKTWLLILFLLHLLYLLILVQVFYNLSISSFI